jgi:hypothetical protein
LNNTEAIACINANFPPEEFTDLCIALQMAIAALEAMEEMITECPCCGVKMTNTGTDLMCETERCEAKNKHFDFNWKLA